MEKEAGLRIGLKQEKKKLMLALPPLHKRTHQTKSQLQYYERRKLGGHLNQTEQLANWSLT